jgi:hypothetical protein
VKKQIHSRRGWYCFGTYGFGRLFPVRCTQPINRDDLFSPNWRGFVGPVIQIDGISGGTSGTFEVAAIIARIFPTQKAFAQFAQREIGEEGVRATDFVFGPFPNDRLMRRSDRIVEYQTPPRCEGLGTMSRLRQRRCSD